MEKAIIAAIAKNNAIGYKNNLLTHIPEDLKRFKKLTTGHTVIMGKNTFYSLPKGALPNRRNIVLSGTEKEFPNCETAKSVEEALLLCKNDEKVFFIGGAAVYKATYKIADCMYITEIHSGFEADAFFPEINYNEWEITFSENHEKSEKAPSFTYKNYIRKK